MEFVTLAWPYLTYKINEFIKKCINETVLIQTTSGPIKGLQQKTQFGYEYAEFRGVPYAKPPIGELRFKVSSDLQCSNIFQESLGVTK